jgi:two-component system phosphate regulon sensor histidine kinase PhoR
VRASELRATALLLLALLVAVGGSYWLLLPGRAPTPPELLRGGAVLLLSLACTALAMVGLRRQWRRQHQHLVDQGLACVLADSQDVLPLPPDPVLCGALSRVRTYLDELRGSVQQAQLSSKNLEIQLRLADAERRQSQTMINGISDAVLVTNGFDELILANPSAAELFGFEFRAGERRPTGELLGDCRLVHDIADTRHAQGRTGRRVFEWERGADAQARSYTVTMTSVVDNVGDLCGVVTVLHDTTREKEVSRMKSEFVSHVSHELRTPLSSIKAYAELLVDGEAADDKTRQEFYHVIQSEADRLSRLIDNILNISRIESGMTRVNKKPVSLTAILKEVLEVAAPVARDKEIELIDQLAPVFFQVEVDRDMIYQAGLNLVSNAIKYTPAGGTVKVAVTLSDDQAHTTLRVTDTGVGIPPEAMKDLFQKFYRVEQHKGMAKGSGLGLNLTRQIIENVHHGHMIVESEIGKGSTFGFTLSVIQ